MENVGPQVVMEEETDDDTGMPLWQAVAIVNVYDILRKLMKEAEAKDAADEAA